MPFVSSLGWKDAVIACALLACVNAVYFLRARTEEQHLSQDPVYLAYSRWIKENGLCYRCRIGLVKIFK